MHGTGSYLSVRELVSAQQHDCMRYVLLDVTSDMHSADCKLFLPCMARKLGALMSPSKQRWTIQT